MLTPIQVKELAGDPGYIWNLYSDRIATISNELTHFSQVAYFSFENWNSAHDFFKAITDKRVCGRAQVRKAERFTTSHEVKVWDIDQSTLEQLIERDRQRQPKSLPLPPLRREWESIRSYDAIQYEAA